MTTTVRPSVTTVIRGRCVGCRTPWALNTISHRVTYGLAEQVVLTDHMSGDDEWFCPMPVTVHSDGRVFDPPRPCGTVEYHDSDDDWGTVR